MTFCVAMKVEEGLVAIADTRVTTGAEAITARKISTYTYEDRPMFVMTSGLRAARDKAITYFEEVLEQRDAGFDKLYKAVNAFAEQVRRAAAEDRESLAESNLTFDLMSLVGGRLSADKEHKLYLLYPQGNWVEVSRGTPYFVIGESSYGKPLLDRALAYGSSLEQALKIGYLAFDATRTSATDVYFPIDVLIYPAEGNELYTYRYEREELARAGEWWNSRLRELIDHVPSDWVRSAFPELERRAGVRRLPLNET